MRRFFLPSPPDGNIITVTGSDAEHIGYSLRMKTGDALTFTHCGTDYSCVITSITKDTVCCEVKDITPTSSEPDIELTIFQAYPKGDKLELIIQKTAELGVCRIVPFLSSRCVARPDRAVFEKKRTRLMKISEEAAKQSGRGIIPTVEPLHSFSEAVKALSECDISLICYENGGIPLKEALYSSDGKHRIGVMIGSEGGFTSDEVRQASEAGASTIWLGERILRCETCPIAVTAIIMSLTGNM